MKDELSHYTERLHAQIKTDLQMLEEHFKTAGHRVEEMVKAMRESVTKRMNDMDKKLEELTSRIQDMEVEVCSMLSSTSLVESTSSPSALTAHTAVDQPSGEAGPLSSTQLSDEGGVTEFSVDIQSPLLQSRTGPSQDAVLTTTRYDESITDQPSEEAGPLSSTQLSDERGVTEISVDIQSPFLLSPTSPSQDAVLTTTRYDESITDQPSEEAGPLSSTQLSNEGGVTEISVDIQSLLLLSRTGPSQDAVLTTTRYDESITDQPSEEAGPLSSTQLSDEGGVTEVSVDIQSPPGSSGVQKWPIACKRKVAQSLEDLEPELTAKLRPYTSLRFSKQEKMTELQAAYFNFQMDRLKITGMFTFFFPLCVEAS